MNNRRMQKLHTPVVLSFHLKKHRIMSIFRYTDRQNPSVKKTKGVNYIRLSVSITSTKIAMNMLRTILNRLLLKNSGTDVRISLKKSVILEISMISCGFNLHKYHLKSLARQLAA